MADGCFSTLKYDTYTLYLYIFFTPAFKQTKKSMGDLCTKLWNDTDGTF